MPATFVLHESDVAKPVAQVEPILGRITATPSLGAQWRPQAGVRAPTRELPQQPQTRRITRAVKHVGAVEGTFTDAEVVAPSGATGVVTLSRHPVSRPATPAEILHFVRRGAC